MMSLAVSKDRVITPTDEDRRRIIKQMKVRTTLKGDKSWIHHQNSDSEDEKKSSPLSGRTSGGSTASAPIAIQSDRSPASKPQSGYLIRGVFTKTIDKTPSVPNPPSSKAAQKSTAMKGPSSCHSSGYRMTTEDYKKLAPYNVKQKSVDLDEKDVPFSPDEHKKRTEAANSVLRRTASRERAYVLSAAKKSSGSPTQEFPPLFAKRIEIEEEGQQRRNPTVSDSRKFTADDNSTNGLKKPTVGPSWNAAKTTAVSPTSAEIGTKSQTNTTLRETSEKISTYAEIRNGESRQTPNGNSSLETVPQHEDGDKKSEPFSWDKPGATAVSTNGSYSEHTEANNGFYLPRSDSGYRDRSADAVDKLQQQYKASPYMDDAKSEPARSEPGAGTHSAAASSRSVLQSDVTSSPAEGTPAHLEDAEYSFKRSVLNYDERGSTQENRFMNSTVPAYSKPDWSEAKSFQDFKEVDAPRNREHESTLAPRDHKLEVAQGGFSDSNHHAGNGQEPPDVHPEPPMSNKHTDHDLSMAMSKDSTSSGIDNNTGVPTYVQSEEFASRRSSSLPREGSTTAPKTQSGNESNTCWESKTSSGYEEQPPPTMHSHHESPGAWRHNEPSPMAASRSNFSSKESALGAYETQHPMPLYMDRQPFNTSVSAPSHRIPSYVGSQGFSTRRPILDYEGRVYDGRSSPRSSRYDSVSARGHCEFNLITTSHHSLPRDTTMSIPPRSHRVPFYMDSLNCNSTRKGVLFVKEYVNSSELSASPRYGSLVDLTDLERGTYSHHRYVSSAPLQRSSEPVCTYCSREIRDCPKIIIEHLNIYCHEYCFRCGICHKAMGDLLDKIFIHRDIVHCDKCYEKLF
ncbi:zinc finger protein 185 isoform X4 [Excalfactoria chinensis]|uniref:zinc finger protein 185 isoform X4 n=1 Tax=Excalfactoria chinensis TaxID=46218 RepID=UPI003B3BDCFA